MDLVITKMASWHESQGRFEGQVNMHVIATFAVLSSMLVGSHICDAYWSLLDIHLKLGTHKMCVCVLS